MHTQGSLLDGRYRVIRHLGSGGMASVLLCEDERLGREVAVKRLHADSPVDVEQRFNREAKLGASLNHPNLVSVFDTATDDEGVLIVMEFVDGDPLSRLLRRGPLRPEEARRLVLDVGEALDHAHAQGIVHRDVKPANVLIREDGVTKLADLGIATASDGTRITRSGIVLGTAAYMAPEQLEGGDVGPAADIYALAAITFEALSGRKPREGTTPIEIAHKLATEGPPDLSAAWPKAPPAAVEVLKRGMARDPADRPVGGRVRPRACGGAQGRAHEDGAHAPLPARRCGTRPRRQRTRPRDPDSGAPPPSRPRTGAPADRARRPGGLALILAIALIALAAAAVVGAVLSGGDDGSSSGAGTPAAPAKKQTAKRSRQRRRSRRRERRTRRSPSSRPRPPPATRARRVTRREAPS